MSIALSSVLSFLGTEDRLSKLKERKKDLLSLFSSKR